MKIRTLTFAVIAILQMSMSMHSQSTTPNRILSGSAGDSRYQFFYETVLVPDGPKLADMGGGTIGATREGTVHRFMTDKSIRAYFGYDVTVNVTPGSDTYRV